MAVLSKHGTELYRYDGLRERYSWRSDGNLMRDTGSGWKLYRKLKHGANTVEWANRARERHVKLDHDKPSYAAFRDLLHELVSFKQRYFVVEALNILPDDPDGFFVELADHNPHKYSDGALDLDLDDCVRLCRAYAVAKLEMEAGEDNPPA